MLQPTTARAARLRSDVSLNSAEYAAMMKLGKKLGLDKPASIIKAVLRGRLEADGLLG
jgi:hypothetical protein